MKQLLLATVISAAAVGVLAAPTTEITLDNYVAAETELNFTRVASQAGINTFLHKEAVTMENQEVIRSNRDVLYSLAVVDVREGATFTVQDSGRYQVIHIIDENHLFHQVVNEGELFHVSKDDLSGGEYVYLLSRTKIIGNDIDEAKEVQKRMTIDSKSAVPYTKNNFDEEATRAFRAELISKASSGEVRMPSGINAFVGKHNPEYHHDWVYGAALGWGSLPAHAASYALTTPGEGSMECSSITFKEPDLKFDDNGYYSITLYNAEGYIDSDNFHKPSDEMKDNGDGTKTVYVNCPDIKGSLTAPNTGWQATLRLYRPTDAVEMAKYIDEYWYKSVSFKPVK